ncbi:hypothetical protein N806_28545 [Rhodococcus sp. P27]|nr:hypothetical protein N806_28545 [Rhodococcus sp. P27]
MTGSAPASANCVVSSDAVDSVLLWQPASRAIAANAATIRVVLFIFCQLSSQTYLFRPGRYIET